MLLHVSVYQCHHQGAHIILTSYLYVGVHYRKNNGISSKIPSVSIVTLWIQLVMANGCWKQWLAIAIALIIIVVVVILTEAISLDIPLFFL
jgi:hypothetical protein